ncbi:MAG: orotate phosphoribosyltransferase [Candidatus Kapaibacterium sp.]|nr:MAG: orotate phosphoribosyltransferase [Candidatus Kapabacteria bacterium]
MGAKLPQRLQGGGIFAVQVQQAGCACMDRDLARAIYERSHLQGDFLLRSGQRSSVYFDKYLFECEPALLRQIAERLALLVPPDAEVLAGLELGGIPLVTALGLATGMPMAFVRKAAKSYGTCKLAEGAPIEGRCVVVIEDVVTSGGQVAESIAALIERGARVDTALCVIDREQGGRELLASNGVELRSLFTMRQLEEAAR